MTRINQHQEGVTAEAHRQNRRIYTYYIADPGGFNGTPKTVFRLGKPAKGKGKETHKYYSWPHCRWFSYVFDPSTMHQVTEAEIKEVHYARRFPGILPGYGV